MNIFDAHFHIIDERFPLIPNNGYLPTSFNCDDYKHFQKSIFQEHQTKFIGGAVVSGSFQGYDQSYLLHALKQLGGQYVGVLQMDPVASAIAESDADLYALHAKGIRAVRFNFVRGISMIKRSSITTTINNENDNDTGTTCASSDTECNVIDEEYLTAIETFIHRIYRVVGWHSEFYIRSSSLISPSSPLFKLLATAPKVVIDHVGLDVDESKGGELGFNLLLELSRTGRNIYVKASGFGRICTLANRDLLVSRLKALIAIRPEGVVFGSDIPGTRARIPFQHADIGVLVDAVGGEEIVSLVLLENGRNLYHVNDHQECFRDITFDSKRKAYALEVQAPFSQYLLGGQKSIETRDYPLPTHLQNIPILLLETDSNIPCKSSLSDSVDIVFSTMSESCDENHSNGNGNGDDSKCGDVSARGKDDPDCCNNTSSNTSTTTTTPAASTVQNKQHVGNNQNSHHHNKQNVRIIGAIVCSHSQEYLTEAMWRNDDDAHLVPRDSAYGWPQPETKKIKFGWHVSEILSYEQTMEYASSVERNSSSSSCCGSGGYSNNGSSSTCKNEDTSSVGETTTSHTSNTTTSRPTAMCQNFVVKRVFRSLFEVEH